MIHVLTKGLTMVSTWQVQLTHYLVKALGKSEGEEISSRYLKAFSASYRNNNSVEVAIKDIGIIHKLSSNHPIATIIYSNDKSADYPIHLRLFQWEKSITLSKIVPILENFDLCVDTLETENIKLGQSIAWISDFSLSYRRGFINIDKVKELFQDAFTEVLCNVAENDDLNKLILGASISWREVNILRAYTKYLKQIGLPFTQPYIERSLASHPEITKNLIALFFAMHDPEQNSKKEPKTVEIEKNIFQLLESVNSLDEDRIFQYLHKVIKATLRTNFFQKSSAGSFKNYLSFKLKSSSIPDLPLPLPLTEIFVYSPKVEGIHLRNSLVSRGGIRWSDRPEDYRTEILGLMKAQKVKNAVIVPSGAKGGFITKELSLTASRGVNHSEIIQCYQTFIRGLLDLTDNLVDGKFISPPNVICYDDIDPYLVVAADKGTSAFSDIANTLAKEYDFWLGDAFASGGSAGYDHKKMGITARGTWESIKRHFRELNIDVMKSEITVAGIGDMSGDVFGNGMIYSPNLKLIAAFDHRHIFLDPNPDPKSSFNERMRLFNLPISTWEDYNPALISKGGAVFKRSLKNIPLTPEVKKALDTDKNNMTPNELIRTILTAPVDLLFNGGIGTYVKAVSESQFDVGDRTNESCRINGSQLRCKVVGEGGNLGFTQLGRIEYALRGGLINADFIDNSAGVDCSDHEVNLKILLDHEIRCGKLNLKSRNALLASLTDEIADLVLKDNYLQALAISFTAQHADITLARHQQYINVLEKTAELNRSVEHLPDEKQFLERKNADKGLTRPELAVILAYTKIQIKNMILHSNLSKDAYLARIVSTAFPPSIQKKYGKMMSKHRLFREIFATQMSNKIVNDMGFTFVYRMQLETGADIEKVVRAYIAASQIFKSEELTKLVESFGFNVSLSTQYEMIYHIRTVINLATRWFLNSGNLKKDLEKLILHFSERVKLLEDLIPNLMGGQAKQYLATIKESFLNRGLSNKHAMTIATYRAIYTSLNIIEVEKNYKYDLAQTAKVYFLIGEKINLLWMRDKIGSNIRQSYREELARLTLRDELDTAQRALTLAAMKLRHQFVAPEDLVNHWIEEHQHSLERWNTLLSTLQTNSEVDYVMFFIAIRELINVINRT